MELSGALSSKSTDVINSQWPTAARAICDRVFVAVVNESELV
jgi:hypothetical protein